MCMYAKWTYKTSRIFASGSCSWPAQGRPRPKVPILGGVYMFTKILLRAQKNVATSVQDLTTFWGSMEK